MDNAKKLQSAIKRKIVLRETLHGSTGHKVKNCLVTYLENGWYNFVIDGDSFDCKWDNVWTLHRYYFRNNSILEKAGYCDSYGVDYEKVAFASSFHFGSGDNIIRTLWVLGEVLSKKKSYDFK